MNKFLIKVSSDGRIPLYYLVYSNGNVNSIRDEIYNDKILWNKLIDTYVDKCMYFEDDEELITATITKLLEEKYIKDYKYYDNLEILIDHRG
jgi:hypothetical protein